jgi:hypothetical protein
MSAGQDSCLDDATVMLMCLALDRTCRSLRARGIVTIEEIVAGVIIEAARQGERDPDRLHAKALQAFDLGETCKSVAA